MSVYSTFPSFKELREVLNIAQKGMEKRIIQINYAPGLRTVVEQECSQLRLSCKVIPYSTLRSPSMHIKEEPPKSLWSSLVKKTASFLIGLNPYAGAALFLADLAIATTSFCLKRSEISLLKCKVGIHTKKHKKYKTIRNVIVVSDLSELSQDDYEYISFLALLIREKYITRTLLVVFQNQNNLSMQLPDNQCVYSLNLTTEMIQNYLNITKHIDDGVVQIVNLVGIQYLEVVSKMIDCSKGNEKSVEKLIALLLEKLSNHIPVDKAEIDSFLKVCSLLFEKFCLIDIESTSPFQESKYKGLLSQCIEGKLLRAFVPDAPLEYAFVENFIREYYRENPAIVFSPQIYNKIFDYLKSAYPQNYTDIALLSGFISLSKHEVLSYYIIAYYHEKFTIAQHKKQKIVSYLQSNTFGECLIQLDNCYKHIIDTPREAILEQCYDMLEETLSQEITIQAKLCVLNITATLAYELENDDNNRLKVMDAYRELLTQAKIFSEPNPIYFEPNLMRAYESFFVDKANFLENHFGEFPTIEKLLQALNIWAERYPDRMFRHFTFPITFGLIERWFE